MSIDLPPINSRLKPGAPGTWRYSPGDSIHGRIILKRLRLGTKAATNLYLVLSPCCGKEIELQEQSITRSARGNPEYPGLCPSCRNRQINLDIIAREKAALTVCATPTPLAPDTELRWVHSLWPAPPMIVVDPQSYLQYLETAR